MEAGALRSGIRQAIAAVRAPTRRHIAPYQSKRFLATPTSEQPFRAAAPIDFSSQQSEDSLSGPNYNDLLKRIRLVPRSPSYFTGKPEFTDDLLHLETLVRKYQTLPVLPPGEAPRIAWRTLGQYKVLNTEPVKSARYKKIVEQLHRLNYIHPSLMPQEVKDVIQRFMRDVQPFLNVPRPVHVDEYGRARGVGRRKSSHAVAFLVEGEGEVLINGKPLTDAFGRLHDRESAIWALKATDRIDKYNVWAVVKGGGTTGQAEALTLAVSKALMVHEPDLKPALRRGELLSYIYLTHLTFANMIISWLRHKRSSSCGEKEAWQAQGPQDACLGQALNISCTYTMYYTCLPDTKTHIKVAFDVPPSPTQEETQKSSRRKQEKV